MLKLLKSAELKSLNCLIKAAILEKEETMSAVWRLRDGLDAILFYQNASAEIKEAIDKIFLYIGSIHFSTLIKLYLESGREHEEYSNKYSEVITLAHQVQKSDCGS